MKKKSEDSLKTDTLAEKVVYNEERKDYTETNINGESLSFDVEKI